jgi:RHS repeat-associated protein
MNVMKRVAGIVSVATLAVSVCAPAAAQTVEYYHLDALGSVRAVTNQAGAVLERHDYLPFGEEVNPPGTTNTRKFTGKERAAETGLDYFGARYYGARTARFTTVDPVYTWRENLVDPQRWNRYAYVRNNPLRFTDPDGRQIRLSTGYSESDYARNAQIRATIAAALAPVSESNPLMSAGVTALDGLLSAFLPTSTREVGDAVNTAVFGTVIPLQPGQIPVGKGPSFVVTKAGEAIPVPRGAAGPIPVETGRGFRFEGGSGGPGLHPDVTGVRIMDPAKPFGPSPGYPGGYVTYSKGSQAVSPRTGKPISKSNPERHIPLKPSGQ